MIISDQFDSTVFFSKGIEYKREGAYSKAEECYMNGVRIDKSDPVGYYNLAKLYYLANMQKASMVNYLRCLHLYVRISWKECQQGSKNLTSLAVSNTQEDVIEFLSNHHDAAPFLIYQDQILTHLGHTILDLDERYFTPRCEALVKEKNWFKRDSVRNKIHELRNSYRKRLSGERVFSDDEILEKDFISLVPIIFAASNLSWENIEQKINPFLIYPDNMHLS